MLPNWSIRMIVSCVLVLASINQADAQVFKPLPPKGIEVDGDVRRQLANRVEELKQLIDAAAKQSDDADDWRPDVDVLVRAVDLAIQQNLFYKKNDPAVATTLLDQAQRRLQSVAANKRAIELMRPAKQDDSKPTLLVGGFRSNIDDSVQPYGLVLPLNFDQNQPVRLDVWLHGRGDSKVELAFLNERMNKIGQYAPDNTIVLHPFGRHCNAFKFAGETDVYEAIDHVASFLKIDRQRIAIRGFSMGGAGCWHMAAHDPTAWFAANPGAGFVDTIVYQGWSDATPYPITDARRKLLQLYDVLPWATNLQNTRLIAYSGEIDKQKQAADRIVKVARQLSFDWDYVIGKGMGHKIDPDSAKTIDAKIANWATQPTKLPRTSIDFTTYTLRYADADWIQVTGLREHWKASRVTAKITASNTLKINTDGITHLALNFADSQWPQKTEVGLDIDGERFYIRDTGNEPGLQCQLVRDQQWAQVTGDAKEIRKRPGVQGPIDDAFYDRFVFVLPTRPAANGVVQRWIDREIKYAQSRWRRLMRGEVRTVNDVDVTQQQIKNCHLICFGDLTSNRYLAKVAHRLPLDWTRDRLTLGGKSYDAATHAAVMCYPNPQNPDRYIVINSGMTFREFSNVSNSRQIAMLPDWAILQVADDFDDSVFAGDVVAEGFFDERWKVKP